MDIDPAEERRRLQALHRLKLLDTAPDPSYDEIISLVAQFLAMPIALISLVDEERQWFKARVGIDAQETARDISFCAHAILSDGGPFIVEDALADPRFAKNPLVTEDPAIRFYAGQPLAAPGGERIGTLCVIDNVPRSLNGEQQTVLRRFASLIERMIAEQSRAIDAHDASSAENEPLPRPAVHLVPRLDGFLHVVNETIAVLQSEYAAAEQMRARLASGDDLSSIILSMNDLDNEGIRGDRLTAALGRLEGSRRAMRVDVFRTLTDQGFSITDIARIWGVSRQLISRMLRDGYAADATLGIGAAPDVPAQTPVSASPDETGATIGAEA